MESAAEIERKRQERITAIGAALDDFRVSYGSANPGKAFFRTLARLNKALLPKLWPEDLAHLTKAQQLFVAWRYWVTRNAL